MYEMKAIYPDWVLTSQVPYKPVCVDTDSTYLLVDSEPERRHHVQSSFVVDIFSQLEAQPSGGQQREQ